MSMIEAKVQWKRERKQKYGRMYEDGAYISPGNRGMRDGMEWGPLLEKESLL